MLSIFGRVVLAAAAAKSLQSCPTLCNPTRLPSPWDSPGKNTGVGYHFLLQCMKVKSESAVAQSCPTPSDPMDCSLPGSVHGIFQARVLEWVVIAFSRVVLKWLKNLTLGWCKVIFPLPLESFICLHQVYLGGKKGASPSLFSSSPSWTLESPISSLLPQGLASPLPLFLAGSDVALSRLLPSGRA